MKQLVILSGKGGTGKTTITGAFTRLAENKAFADCDVDAPNLHLLLKSSQLLQEDDFYALKKAVKYHELCVECGQCEENCRFDAIKDGQVIPYRCEGCGVCEWVCPVSDACGKAAIRLEDHISGHTYLSRHQGEIFSHAQLATGNGASGKLVTEVRKKLMHAIALENLVIIDGSPGIGCPVIASVTGTNAVLVVTEPSLSGLHDLKRLVETARRFEVPCAVCINKYDVNIEITQKIEKYCDTEGIRQAGRIPYDPTVIQAVNSNRTIVEYPESPAARAAEQLWLNVCTFLRAV